jgi:hypothetical protein
MLRLVHPLMMKPRNALICTQLQFKTHSCRVRRIRERLT